MITAAPSLSTLQAEPSPTRLGESRRERRGNRCTPGTGSGAGPAGGKATSALAEKPFLQRERRLISLQGPGWPQPARVTLLLLLRVAHPAAFVYGRVAPAAGRF